MTDRVKGVYVTFDRDIREDDVQVVMSAISMIRGVLTVKPVVADINDHMNRERIRREIEDKIWKALHEG